MSDPPVVREAGAFAMNGRNIFRLGAMTLLVALSGVAGFAGQVLKRLDDTSYAALTDRSGLHLDVRVLKPEELTPALRGYCGVFDGDRFNLKKLGIERVSAHRALIPYYSLSPLFRKALLLALWPKDRLRGDFWVHRVTHGGHETLWSISQWFTGSGQHYRAIKKASGMRSDRIKQGMTVKIPAYVLLHILKETPEIDLPKPKDPVFASDTRLADTETLVQDTDPEPRVSPPPGNANQAVGASGNSANPPATKPAAKPEKPAKEENGDSERFLRELAELKRERAELRYGSDGQGPYAQYRLKRGEAIYSAVVVRFCGLVRAEDVNRVADIIIQRNRIRDETDLAVGTPIRIPSDYLEPEYKPEADPEYQAFIENMRGVSRMSTRVVSRNLEGVHLILDAGHGGRDPGAHFGKVWEDDFVYDIMCRIKLRLEKESAATIWTTILDPSVQYKVQDVHRFNRDHDEVLLTTPRFSLNSPRVTTDGVNLRWMLANHRFQQLLAQGVKEENVLFASLHADSLHPSIQGNMVYIPDARVFPRRVEAYSKFRKYLEYKGNHFSFSQKTVQQAQARSLNFANNFIALSRSHGVRVHRQKPIRSVIYRNPKRPYVPAVVRYNRVPTRCLIEVCNLNNRQDRNRLSNAGFRQKIADVFVESVYKTYGVTPVDQISSLGEKSRLVEE